MAHGVPNRDDNFMGGGRGAFLCSAVIQISVGGEIVVVLNWVLNQEP